MRSEPPLAQAELEHGDGSEPSDRFVEDDECPPRIPPEESDPSSHSHIGAMPSIVDGRYRVEACIGRGGTAEIFRVIDDVTGRPLALKRLQPSAAAERSTLRLFEREYYTLSSLKHPKIIEVYDYGRDESPYYTMELVEGHDLRELAPLQWEVACRYLRDLASSLALLHTRRLVHRDVSPRNARVDTMHRCMLLDFGALVPFGTTRVLVGTAPCTPPEAYYKMFLDQRADLYGLGAVAYWLLTRRHAYAARRFERLPDFWKRRPLPPSELTPGIPPALDALVMALLSLDPLERPTNTADVIDQLCSIAGLEPERDLRVARAYFSVPRLVGRSAQLEVLRDSIASAVAGEGSTVFIEAETGVGKSRLLTELQIEARMRGTSLIRVDAEVHRGPFGVAEAIARALLDEVPGAAEAIASHETLAQLSPAVREKLSAPLGVMSSSAGERRAVLQAALETWLDALSRVQPIAIAVDNVHRADQASAALLLTLSQRASRRFLLLIVTNRSSETISAPETIHRLRSRSVELRLPRLLTEEINALLEGVFGRVPYIHRYAELLSDLTGGNPLYCLEIVQHLVENGVATYDQGTWRLREDVPRELCSAKVQEGFLHSIGRLSRDGRMLAETLSVYRGALSLDLCIALIGPEEPKRVYELLNELVEKDILLSLGDTYQFRQNAVRELLARSLQTDRRQTIHLRFGRALLSLQSSDPMLQIEAGWHLLRAGAESEGAELLARLAHETHAFRAIDTDLQAAVPALTAALDVFRRQQRDSLAQIPLLASLIEAGYYVDFRIAERYSEEALHHLRQATGLALAERLRPRVGGVLGLGAGLLKARLAFLGSKSGHPYPFDELFVRLISVVAYLCGISVICLDPVKAIRYARVLEPLSVLGKRKAPAGLFDFCMTLTMMAQDRFSDARQGWLRLIRALGDPDMYRELPDETRRLFLGGAWYGLGVLESFRDDGTVLDCATELDKLGLKFYEIVADRLRVSYHAYRGEEAEANHYRDRLDVRASQTGSAWQVEVWDSVASITAYARTRDRMGLKRCAERLQTLSNEIPSLASHAKTAEGYYRLLRNEPHRAIALYESVLKGAKPRDHIGWAAEHGQLASAYNAAGEHAKARARCLYALEHVPDADRDFVIMTLELEIELAVAEAELGNPEKSARKIEAWLERFRVDRGPVTLAQLYEGRARIALAAKDTDLAEHYFSEMERVARSTNNPALVARWKRALRRLSDFECGSPADRGHFEPFRPDPISFERMRIAVPIFLVAGDDDDEAVTATESRRDRE